LQNEFDDLFQRIEAVKNKLTKADSYAVEICEDFTIHIGEKTYVPSKTLTDFHNDKSELKLIMGPVGSGKTVGCCMDLLIQACTYPHLKDNTKSTRWAVIRNTYSALRTTTWKSYNDWYKYIPKSQKSLQPPLRYYSKFKAKVFGVIEDVEMETFFISIDTENDLDKLFSLEVSGMYWNEAQFLPSGLIKNAPNRCGRYPADEDLRPDEVHLRTAPIIMDTNPPDIDHWLYNRFVQRQLPNHAFFHQPPNAYKNSQGKWCVNPDGDNVKNLRDGYYDTMLNSESDDYIRVYACGEWGALIKEGSYYGELLSQCEREKRIIDFDINPNYPVHTAWDLGMRHNTSIWFFQVCDANIRLLYFYQNVMEPPSHYANVIREFKDKYKIYYGFHFMPIDIKGHRGYTGETGEQAYFSEGITPYVLNKAKSVQEGIDQVKKTFWLFMFHRTNCVDGIRCLRGYHRPYNQVLGTYGTKPAEDGNENCADALRYLVTGWNEAFIDKRLYEDGYLDEY
jgi:hypothetical protein